MIDFLALYTLKGVSVKLLKETKSLKVTINGTNCSGKFDWKVIRNLRQILNWSHQHLEVESIIIDNKFSEYNGHDLEQFEGQESSDVLNYFKVYQELLTQMLKSPQYIIVDMGKQYSSSLLDFALACDFRVSHSQCILNSDLHENCLLPTNVLMTMGSHHYGQAFVRDVCLNHSQSNNQNWLKQIMHEQYSNDTENDVILKKALNLNLKLSAVTRIQTKALLFSEIENQLNFSFQNTLEYLNASLISGEFFSNLSGLFERANPREIRTFTMHEEKSSQLRSV
jgi:hypothetical protein